MLALAIVVLVAGTDVKSQFDFAWRANGLLEATEFPQQLVPQAWKDIVPVWVTTRKRLYRIGDDSHEEEYIAEFKLGAKLPFRAVRLAWQPRFDHIIGNPEVGDFALIESDGSGRFTHMNGLFTKNLNRLSPRINWVSDIGPYGILAERGTEDNGGYWHLKAVACLRPDTGKVIWSAPCATDELKRAARWHGRNVFVGEDIRDGATGRKVGGITPETFHWLPRTNSRKKQSGTHRAG